MRNDVLALEKLFVGIFLREKWGGVREREGEREIVWLFHLFMHSLVDSCMCPYQGLNPQTHNLGILGQCSNQLSYPARVEKLFKSQTSQDFTQLCLVHIFMSLKPVF